MRLRHFALSLTGGVLLIAALLVFWRVYAALSVCLL